MRRRTIAVALAAGLPACLAPLARAQSMSWAMPADGDWSNAANWSPANVPDGAGENAVIAVAGMYTVSFDTTATIGSLMLTNPDATLRIVAGRTLRLSTDSVNEGQIVLHDAPGNANTSSLNFSGDAVIDGAGTIVLASPSTTSRAAITSAAGVVGTIGADQSIRGHGAIFATLDVLGTIVAPFESVIELSGATIDLTGGGTIRSDGGNVSMTGNAVVRNGTVGAGPGGGRVESTGFSYFEDVTIDTVFTVAPSGRLQINAQGITNNGQIRVHDTPGNANTAVLNFAQDATIGGTGTVMLAGQAVGAFRSTLTTTSGVVGTIGADQTLEGTGTVTATLNLLGTATAQAGDLLELQGATIDLTGGGTIRSDGGNVSMTGNAVVRNGTVGAGPGGGRVESTGFSYFENVTIDTVFTVAPSGRLQINAQGITNNGQIRVHDTPGNANTAVLNFAQDATIGGTGTVFMGGQSVGGFRSTLTTTSGVVGTIGADQTLEGTGTVTATLNLLGTATAQAGDLLELQGATIDLTGGGTIRSDGGNVALTGNAVVRNGTVGAGPGGGRVESTGFSYFEDVTIDTVFTVAPSGRLQINAQGITNNGQIRVHDTPGNANTAVLNFAQDATIDGTGTVMLAGQAVGAFRSTLTTTSGVVATLGEAQTLAGVGTVSGTFNVLGSIAPGQDGVGELDIPNSSVTLADTSVVRMELAGTATSTHDRIDANGGGAIHLDGALVLEFVDDYVPQIGDEFILITSNTGGISGDFSEVIVPGDIQRIRITNTPNQYKIGYTCLTDINGDFIINNTDINAFITGFLNQGPLADINNDGIWNNTDINLFVQLFLGGCV